jgi:hypothetical protein
VARYVLSEMRAFAQQDGFRLVLAMDGVRDAIYAGKGLESYEVGKRNRRVGEVASELDTPLLERDPRLSAGSVQRGASAARPPQG